MTQITLEGPAFARLPVLQKDAVVFNSVTEAMNYVERAEHIALRLHLHSQRIRALIVEAMRDDPAISFGKAAPPVAEDDPE